MNKKETTKFIVQLIASIASAILTALGATSCMGYQKERGIREGASFRFLGYARDDKEGVANLFLYKFPLLNQLNYFL